MIRKTIILTIVVFLASTTLLADFGYQETSTITGGAMAAMMKVAGVFSRSAREPMKATVAFKGNRMAHRSEHSASIIDLDAQTITTIDMQKKQYTVMTFEQMKKMLDDAAAKMQGKDKNQAEMTWKVSASSTGNSKQIAGFEAKEMLVKMTMEGTDRKSGQTGGMDMVMRTWFATGVPGAAEARDFQRRMAEKLAWAPGGNMFMARPDIAKGMADAMKEMSKLEGTPVLMTMSMGPAGSVNENSTPAPASQPAAEQPQQQEKPSLGGALGGALGGKFGLGRKKNQDNQQQAPKEQPAQQQGSASLLDMTTEYSGFSTAAADPSLFEVPAGFKKVEPKMQ